jgi:hypothetical protein
MDFAVTTKESNTPIEKSWGVEGDFPIDTLPFLSIMTQSVKVPPVSTPIKYSIIILPP